MKQINYTGSSKLISRIVSLLNRKAPLPLDGNGDPDWGTNGQVLTTDGSGNTSWGAGGGGGDSVSWTQTQLSGDKIAEIDINGTTTDVYAPSPTLAGHTIEKSDGTDMTARALLQFIGAYLQDDAGNDRTIANIVRTMTQAQFNNLSAAEKEGLIYVSDAAGQLTASEVALAAIAGMSATTVQSAIQELKTYSVSTLGGTMTGSLTVPSPLFVKGSSYWYVSFLNGSGTEFGRIGVDSSGNPYVWYNNNTHKLISSKDVEITKAHSGASNYVSLTVPSVTHNTFEIITPFTVYTGACDSSGNISYVKGVDGTTPSYTGNTVSVYVGAYYRTAVLKSYGHAY